MVRYRSTYCFYGDIPLVELTSCDDMTVFWKIHSAGWIIVRNKEFMNCPKKIREKIKMDFRKPVGRGHEYLVTIQKLPPNSKFKI